MRVVLPQEQWKAARRVGRARVVQAAYGSANGTKGSSPLKNRLPHPPIRIGDHVAESLGRISVFEPPLSETPSTKPQAPEKFQISNAKPQKQMPGQTARRSVFELGAWCFFGAWSLELGACCLVSQLLKNWDAVRQAKAAGFEGESPSRLT